MRLAGKVTSGLVILASLFVAAPPAYADDPSLSVDSVTFTPGG